MEDLALAAEKVAVLMRLLTTTGRLRLKYRITAGAGAVDPDGFERRDIYVECKGPDTELLLGSDGELLRGARARSPRDAGARIEGSGARLAPRTHPPVTNRVRRHIV